MSATATPTVWQLIARTTGALRAGPAVDRTTLRAAEDDERLVQVPRPIGLTRWDPDLTLADGGAWAVIAAPPAPHLSVAQFRDRWTWAEQIRFELLAAAATTDGAELRAIRATLEDRRVAGIGVDPTSAKSAAMLARCVALGALDADRVPAIAAAVGTYAREDGYVAPPPSADA